MVFSTFRKYMKFIMKNAVIHTVSQQYSYMADQVPGRIYVPDDSSIRTDIGLLYLINEVVAEAARQLASYKILPGIYSTTWKSYVNS